MHIVAIALNNAKTNLEALINQFKSAQMHVYISRMIRLVILKVLNLINALKHYAS